MATAAAELEVRTTLKDDASKKVEGLGLSFGKLSAAFGVGTLAANAVSKATAFVTDTIKGSITAAQEAQVSQAKVNAILKTLTGSYEDHAKAVDAASKSAMKLGFDDEDAAESMAKLLQVTGDTTKANTAFQAAMDLARFKGISLQDSTMAVNMALQGNTRVLKQLGVDIPDNATKMELLGLVHEKVAGQAQAFADTAAGAQEKFKVAMENLQESIGDRVLPIVTRFFNTVSNFVSSDTLQGWLNRIGDMYNNYIAPVIRDYVIPAFNSLKKAIEPHIPLIQGVLKVLFGVAGAALIGTLIVASETVKILGKAFDIVATAIEKVINWIKQAIGWFKQIGDKINDFKNATGSAIGNTVGNIGDFFKNLFKAEGGPVMAGQPYIVGERGPEMFVPSQNGRIIPNGAGGASVNINFNGITVSNQSDLDQIIAAVKSVTARELKLANLGV